MDKENIKKEIKEKIEQFLKNKEYYNNVSEIETAEKFISPIFSLLGWDIEGKEHFDEVIREDNIAGKRVDYSFRIESLTKFILEAKAVSKDINQKEFIEQAIKYAYNKNCRWAILTNFRQLKIFYLDKDSKNAFRNIDLLDLSKFEENFEDLLLLSKELIDNKELDLKAEREGRKDPSIKVDKYLYNDLNEWRLLIFKDIKRDYGNYYNNFQKEDIIQRIINRLIFIRKTEDIPIEDIKLKPLISQSNRKVYSLLKEVFKEYAEKYDSDLFSSHECDKIDLRNDTLLKILNGLYFPEGKVAEYNFHDIEDDVLGQIYERYLGYILKIKGAGATGEQKITHRHEQGIYYTPTAITNYIVKNTIGDLLKNKKINLYNLKVLDPACGSGSFLIKSFNYLNNYYSKKVDDFQVKLDTINENVPISKKAEIIKNNLFGVDIDSSAIEIVGLNLLLKLADKSLLKIREKHKILPILKNNIKVGDSLIDDKIVTENNPFNWKDNFSFNFDIIIGNPPYISYYSRKAEFLDDKKREYFAKNYKVVPNRWARINSIQLFFEKAHNLCKDGGYIGFIVDRTLLEQKANELLRDFLLKNMRIIKIVSELKEVFEEQKVDVVIIILKKEKMYDEKTRKYKKNMIDWVQNDDINEKEIIVKINQSDFLKNKRKEFICISRGSIEEKFVKDTTSIADVCILKSGINPGGTQYRDYFILDEKKNNLCHPFLKNSINIDRYFLLWKEGKDKYINYDHALMKKLKDEAYKHLHKGKGKKVSLIELGDGHIDKRYDKEKIILRQSAGKIIATFDSDRYYTSNSFFILNQKNKDFDLKYVLALLNSDLFTYYSLKEKIILTGHKKQPQIRMAGLKKLKIKNCGNQKPFIELVDELLKSNKKLAELGDKETEDVKRLKEDIKNLQLKLNNLVYNLYDIREEEKEIIKKS